MAKVGHASFGLPLVLIACRFTSPITTPEQRKLSSAIAALRGAHRSDLDRHYFFTKNAKSAVRGERGVVLPSDFAAL